MLRGARAIRDAYRDERVAAAYIDERFRQPLGALLHRRQGSALRRLISSRGLTSVLEVAPGPARLTVEVAALAETRGVVVDASAEMLAEARRRLEPTAGRRWTYVQGDAFALPFHAEFDLVYAFRLIRHFGAGDRAQLYAQLARVLKPGGYLVFDAVNEVVSAPLRANAQPGEYSHFDALLTPDEVRAEVVPHGFAVESLAGVQHRYGLLLNLQTLLAPRAPGLAGAAMGVIDRAGCGEPLEWIVTCRRV